MKSFRFKLSLPIQLVFVILFVVLCGNRLPLMTKQIAYAVSLTIKGGLIFALPFVVFCCIFSSLVELKRKSAALMVTTILAAICASNFASTMIAFIVGRGVVQQNWVVRSVDPSSLTVLDPYWHVPISPLVSNDKALLFGIIFGVIASVTQNARVVRTGRMLGRWVQFVLYRLFIPLVPVFILGFVIKLHHESILESIVTNYTLIFILIACVEIMYIGFLFYVGSGFSLTKTLIYIRNVVPSVVAGFSAMSSAVSMPLTLAAAEKNTDASEVPKTVIPMTANNHLIGDSVFIPIMALVVMASAGQASPGFMEYLPFALYFVAAKFAVAAVPGGGIIVMLPILEKHLGLSSDSLSLMTALYILFDPFITAMNVAGNGAFAVLLSRVFNATTRQPLAAQIPLKD